MNIYNQRFVVATECQDLLVNAVIKHQPLEITNQQEKYARPYQSNFLGVEEDSLILAFPDLDTSERQIKLTEGSQIAVTFEMGHHKYLFSTQVIGQFEFEDESQVSVPALSVSLPEQIEQSPRRNFDRVPVSSDEPVPVTLLGLSGQGGRSYVIGQRWQGELYNLSVGNVGITIPKAELPDIPKGQHFEIWFAPIPDRERLCLRIQFCHATVLPQGDQVMLGFRLIAQEVSEEDGAAPCQIDRVVDIYRQRQNKLKSPHLVNQ
jgi:c-di-GMP-binding flagellar brake protein YcgR